MPAWLAAALALLRSAGLGAALGGGALAVQETFGDGFGGFNGPLGLNGMDKKRRRRRRRALTASDRADIAFLAGILGKPAAKELAAIIASRT